MTANPLIKPEELLAHAGWMRSLANRLLGDPNTAEDIFQDAFVTAAGPASRPIQKPRAWLSGVLHGLARDRQRADRSRAYRERRHAMERPCTAPSVEEVVAQAQTQKIVADAVLALEEPLQRVVVLRWFEGRSAAQIAQLDRVPASTVRSRLQRAMHVLRKDLENRLGMDWRSALLPLIPTPNALSTSKLPLGVLMSSSTKALLVASCLGILGLSYLNSSPITPEPAAEPPPVLLAGEDRGSRISTDTARVQVDEPGRVGIPITTGESAIGPPERPVALAPDPPLPDLLAGQLEVYVTQSGRPVESGWVHLSEFRPSAGPPDPWSKEEVTQHPIGPDGIARLEDVGTKGHCTIVVEIDQGLYRQNVRLNEDAGQRVHVDLSANVIYGVVYDERGQPVPQVAVNCWGPPMDHRVWGRTDDQGRYELQGFTDGRLHLVVVRDPELRSSVVVASGATVEHDIGAAVPWARVHGTLLDTTGNPIAGHDEKSGPLSLRSLDGTWSRNFALNSEGAIDLQAPPGVYKVSVKAPCSRSHKWAVLEEEFELKPDGQRVSWVLPGATVRGRVYSNDTGLRAENPDGGQQRFGLLTESGTYLAHSLGMNADGTYMLQGVKPGSYSITGYRRPLVQSTHVEVTDTTTEIVQDIYIE